MRWNCPHCGITLAISDEKMGTGWSFSRCYHCGGFALVRRTDVNLIKVDQAPPGEHVLLPESAEQPLLSQEATRHLQQKTKPVVRPAARSRASAPASLAEEPAVQLSSGAEIAAELRARERVLHSKSEVSSPASPPPFLRSSLLTKELPDPIPEELEEAPIPKRSRWLRLGIGVSAFLALGSGLYLTIEGQELLKKARESASAIVPEKELAIKTETTSMQVADAEIVQAPALTSKTDPAQSLKTEIVDRLQREAMAPLPQQNEDDTQRIQFGLVVKPKYNNSPLRAGPGLNYPILGLVNPEFRYSVSDWKNEWFKVTIEDPEKGILPSQSTPKHLSKVLHTTAWIRNDLVRILGK